MRFLDELRDDHWAIETMLGVLEACAARLESGRRLHREVLEGVLSYFQRFVVAGHHVKEEAALYPLLVAKGADKALVQRLETGHAATLQTLQSLAAIVRRLTPDDGEMRRVFAREVHRFSAAVREHHRDEMAWLRAMTASLLTDADDRDLTARFAEIARWTIGPTGPEYFRQVVADYRDIASTWGHWPDRDGR